MVRDELRAAVDVAASRDQAPAFAPVPAAAVEPLSDMPMYQVDPLLRRAVALQQTRVGKSPAREYQS